MELSFDKLCKFDLIEEFEETLLEKSKVPLCMDFINTMQEIQSIDQFIKDSPSFPGSTDKIVRGELVSAIGATLAIEGTTLEREEIEESLRKASLKEKLERKEQEAENSRKVYSFIIELVNDYSADFAYEEKMIKQIHKYFTEGMNYLSNTPGEYRGDFAVTFGDPRKTSLCRNRAEVNAAMTNFISWLNQTGSGILSSNIIVKAIMAHYYLTEIHPFSDGNGRTARALEALTLYVNGTNNYCFWSLANFWSTHKDKYLIHLGNIRATCNPWDFVLWGMKGYLDEIKRIRSMVLKKVKQLMLMDYAKYLLANKKNETIKINHRIVALLNLLVGTDSLPLEKLQASPEMKALYTNVSSTTRYRDLKKMLEIGLIVIDKDEGGKFYIGANFQILERLKYNV